MKLILSFLFICCNYTNAYIQNLNELDITFYKSLENCNNNSHPITMFNKTFPTDCGCVSFEKCKERLDLDKLFINVYKNKIQIDTLDYNIGCTEWGNYYYNYNFYLYYKCLIDLILILGLVITILCFCGCIFVIYDNNLMSMIRFRRYKKETFPDYQSINIINN